MLYNYPPEVNERFEEVFIYRSTDFQKCVDGYLSIIEDYAHESGVLAKAYYFLAEAVALQSNFRDCEKYCLLSIEHGKKSGNKRCQNLSIIKLSGLKIDQHNETMAADYLYDVLDLLKANQDEDLYDIVHILLGSLFEKAEDYKTALAYYNLSIAEMLAALPDAKTSSPYVYFIRVLAMSECYIKLNQPDALWDIYNDLKDSPFESIPPVFQVAVSFLEGYLAYMNDDKEKAVTILRQTINDYKNTADVFDTYFIPENIYHVFESYQLREDQKVVLDLLEHYSKTTNGEAWQFLYTQTKIGYCKDTGDKQGLLEAYESYYTNQQNYHDNSRKQMKEYFKLRKRLYEERIEYEKQMENLNNLSTTDALTGLYNRHALLRHTPETLQRATKNKVPFGVLLIDIDNYKQYNDLYGHVPGDECLQKLGSVLNKVLQSHFCARYGGDEFICIFYGIYAKEIQNLCDQIHKSIADLQLVHAGNPAFGRVTVSMGCSVRLPKADDDFVIFLKEADECLYRSKEKGRNRTEIN